MTRRIQVAYIVTVDSKYPVAGEHPDEIEVHAYDLKDAVARARREMADRGYDRHDGPFIYKARRA